MAIERRNPIPKGRYWVAIFDSPKNPKARFLFDNYLTRNSATIAVIRKESVTDDFLSSSGHDWYLFDVTSPTTWELNQGFGLPTIVKSAENPNAPEVTSPDDVVTRPPQPPSIMDQLQDLLSDAKTIGLGIALVWAIGQLRKRR